MFDFTGKNAVVTGASRGIGEACARQLDEAGARVALIARSVEALEKIAAGLRNEPVVIAADLATEDGTLRAASRSIEALGGVDFLVNNAGVGVLEPTKSITTEALDLQLVVNLRNLILLTSALTDSLVARRGSIVNISSIGAYGGGPGQAVYAASKGGVNALTANLCRELGPLGVRVNCVAPGLIDTDIWEPVFAAAGEAAVRARLLEQVPIRRWGEPEDIASVVCFFCSDAASYISGQSLRVDGGFVG